MDDKIVVVLRVFDTMKKFELLSFFDAANEKSYAALMPLNEDETPEENAAVQLLRANPVQTEDGEDFEFESIADEEEFNYALEAFSQLQIIEEAEPGEGEPLEDALPVISLMNAAGHYEDCQLVDVFDVGKRKYVAVMPMETETGEPEVRLFRAEITEQDGVEGINVSSIPSDM